MHKRKATNGEKKIFHWLLECVSSTLESCMTKAVPGMNVKKNNPPLVDFKDTIVLKELAESVAEIESTTEGISFHPVAAVERRVPQSHFIMLVKRRLPQSHFIMLVKRRLPQSHFIMLLKCDTNCE